MFEESIEQLAYETAIEAGIKAGLLSLKYWPNPSNSAFDRSLINEIFDKDEGIGNYATLADIESEKVIIETIRDHSILKGHSIVSEEADEIVADPIWQWVIDPIDGTPPFRFGLSEFGICIGVLRGYEPIIGVIAMPALHQLIAARSNHGAYLMSFQRAILADLKELKVDRGIEIEKVLVGYDLGYQYRSKQIQEIVAKVVDKVGYTVSYGSTSTASFRMAQGSIGGYFSQRPTKFDIAAASVIIREIGGVVTDFQGDLIDWSRSGNSFLAARSPYIHSRLLQMINS
jgi:myo-inositol-1(or 4)-monophosphatase